MGRKISIFWTCRCYLIVLFTDERHTSGKSLINCAMYNNTNQTMKKIICLVYAIKFNLLFKQNDCIMKFQTYIIMVQLYGHFTSIPYWFKPVLIFVSVLCSRMLFLFLIWVIWGHKDILHLRPCLVFRDVHLPTLVSVSRWGCLTPALKCIGNRVIREYHRPQDYRDPFYKDPGLMRLKGPVM